MNKAVFLDRDGTIVVDKQYLADADGIELIEGAGDALRQLAKAGFQLIVISNQSGIGRGYFSDEQVQRQHHRLRQLLADLDVPLDGIYYCPHAPEADCRCRKPNPGLLLDAAAEHSIDCAQSYMIGDKPSDVLAGKRSGCRTILIGCDANGDADAAVATIQEAAALILKGA